jgi:hypothetical protein
MLGTTGEGEAMTEAEWLTWKHPARLLEHLRGEAGKRKLRLFACACCRRVIQLMPDPRSHRALDVAERVADGSAGAAEWERASASLRDVEHDHASWALTFDAFIAAERGAAFTAHAAQAATRPALRPEARRAEEAVQADLVRDIFGNPFRREAPGPNWLTSDVQALARGIYESRDFSAMPILADALQDADCDSEDVLAHCRGPGPHVRGCWVVDLLLGKE